MRPPLLFRALLRLYPASFRNDYGKEMARVLAERRREARGAGQVASLWIDVALDAVASAARTHADLFRQDAGYALRTFRRAPGFTATVLLVCALGVGANTAAFSLTHHVLLRPLPFAEPDRLAAVWQQQDVYNRTELSPAVFRDLRASSRSFEAMAVYTPVSANLVGQGTPERLEGVAVDAALLPLLGVAPALGRGFTEADDREGAPPTLLLAHGLWQSAFGGDPAVVGRTVSLDGAAHTVIGVMPRGFAFPARETRFLRPFRFGPGNYEDRNDTYLRAVGRLAPGVSVAQADAELDLLQAALTRAHPDMDRDVRAFVNPLARELPSKARTLVLALSGAAACVLLIACLNLANLLLVRGLTRRRELALRTALGAGRERLVRQQITESLLLALGGGLLGVFAAVAALPLLGHLVPSSLPIAGGPTIDLTVLGVALGVTVLAGLLFGVVPAVRGTDRLDADALHASRKAGRARLRRALVVVEVGLSLVLLVSSGLLLRALWRLESTDPGFDARGVFTARTWLPWPKYEKTGDRARFYERVLDETRAVPGVSSASYISFLPMVMTGGIWGVTVPGREVREGDRGEPASLRFVTPGFFDTLAIPLRAGRDVRTADTMDTELVAVVSESLASHFFPGESALGRRIKVGPQERTIVGIVGDIRVRGLEIDSEPQLYLPYRQVPDGWMMFYPPKDLVVRSSLPPAALEPRLREIVARADPEQPVSNARSLEAVLDEQTASRRVQLHVLGAFAALALGLAALGIYGLLAFAVSRRTQEIGVRMALGATPRKILTMVLGEGLVLAAAGAALGLGLAYAAGILLRALLAGVAPTDAPALVAALAVALVMTLAGSVVPAWRAARVDPAVVMRAE
jgi:predicted permease